MNNENKKNKVICIVSIVLMIISIIVFLITYYCFKQETYLGRMIEVENIFNSKFSQYIYMHVIIFGIFNIINLIILGICYFKKRINKLVKICSLILGILIIINFASYIEAKQTYRDLYIEKVYELRDTLENVANNLYNTDLNLNCKEDEVCVKYFFKEDIENDLSYGLYTKKLEELGNSKCEFYITGVSNIGEISYNAEIKCDGRFNFSTIEQFGETFELNKNDNQDNGENETNNDINEAHIDLNIQDYITLSSTDKDKSTYKINIYNALKNINISEEIANLKQEKEYNVNFNFVLEQYNFNIKINKGYYGIIYYDLYVNDKKLINDTIRCQEEENITINVLGDYIIMRPHFITDIDQALNIIYKTENGLQVKNIFELDENEGMRIRKIDITNNGIILEGSRMSHGPSVVYNKIPYMLLYKEDCEDTKNLVPKDLVVFAKYNYKYENGVLNLVPEVTNLGTFEQELLNNDRYCQNR